MGAERKDYRDCRLRAVTWAIVKILCWSPEAMCHGSHGVMQYCTDAVTECDARVSMEALHGTHMTRTRVRTHMSHRRS